MKKPLLILSLLGLGLTLAPAFFFMWGAIELTTVKALMAAGMLAWLIGSISLTQKQTRT